MLLYMPMCWVIHIEHLTINSNIMAPKNKEKLPSWIISVLLAIITGLISIIGFFYLEDREVQKEAIKTQIQTSKELIKSVNTLDKSVRQNTAQLELKSIIDTTQDNRINHNKTEINKLKDNDEQQDIKLKKINMKLGGIY